MNKLGRIAGLGALLLLLGALSTGCEDSIRRHGELLAAAERDYDRGAYADAVTQLDVCVAEAPTSADAARAYYARALSLAQLGRRASAYRDLERALELTVDADLRWRAGVTLGTLHFEDRRWEAAARALADAVEYMPAAEPADDVLWRLGTCYERSGNWSLASGPFARLVEQFPHSRLAEGARRRLALRADHFAIQCGVFRTSASADKLEHQLKNKGLPAYVRTEPRDGARMNVVLVGRYQHYESAYEQLAAVRRYVPDAIVWP